MRQDTLYQHSATIEQVKAIKANDEKTLKALYQNNYYKVEGYILNNKGSSHHAKDIYQEAFIAVWRNIQLDRFHPENENALAGYLYQVARNKWLDYLRSGYHKNITTMEDVVNALPVDILPEEESEYLNAVKSNFNNLSPGCKEVLTMFYYQKQPLKAIAETFDWTLATARNNKYRCIERLRELIKK